MLHGRRNRLFFSAALWVVFLNVCIYRMPRNESIAWPGSHCTKCKKKIAWTDNIPVISYLVLRGKCRQCKEKISPIYPLVELLGGVACLAAWMAWTNLPYQLMGSVIFLSLIVVTFIDFEHQIIPDEISLSGIVIGIIFSIFYPAWHGVSGGFSAFVSSVAGLFIGGGFLLVTALLAEKMLKKEAMGGGDIKLLAMIGAFLGWKGALLTLFFASLLGSMIAIVLKYVFGQERIPFGPYLALGMVFTMLYGEKTISWYIDSVIQY